MARNNSTGKLFGLGLWMPALMSRLSIPDILIFLVTQSTIYILPSSIVLLWLLQLLSTGILEEKRYCLVSVSSSEGWMLSANLKACS